MAQDSNRSPGLLGYRPFLLCDVQDLSGFLQKNILTPLKFTKEDIVDILPATDFQALALTGLLMKDVVVIDQFGEGLSQSFRIK